MCSANGGGFSGEIEVKEKHENGTIQSFFDMDKIKDLISNSNFAIKWCELVSAQNDLQSYFHQRWYLVLEKK